MRIRKLLPALWVLPAFQLCLPLLVFAAEQSQSAGGLTSGQETLSLATAVFKTVGALIIVIGLMLLVLFWIKKTGLVRGMAGNDGLITILDTRMLAPKKQVSVLEVAGSYLVVGISEQSINLLATLEANDRLNEARHAQRNPPPLPDTFAAVLNRARQGLTAIKPKKEGSPHAE